LAILGRKPCEKKKKKRIMEWSGKMDEKAKSLKSSLLTSPNIKEAKMVGILLGREKERNPFKRRER